MAGFNLHWFKVITFRLNLTRLSDMKILIRTQTKRMKKHQSMIYQDRMFNRVCDDIRKEHALAISVPQRCINVMHDEFFTTYFARHNISKGGTSLRKIGRERHAPNWWPIMMSNWFWIFYATPIISEHRRVWTVTWSHKDDVIMLPFPYKDGQGHQSTARDRAIIGAAIGKPPYKCAIYYFIYYPGMVIFLPLASVHSGGCDR